MDNRQYFWFIFFQYISKLLEQRLFDTNNKNQAPSSKLIPILNNLIPNKVFIYSLIFGVYL